MTTTHTIEVSSHERDAIVGALELLEEIDRSNGHGELGDEYAALRERIIRETGTYPMQVARREVEAGN